MHKNLDDSLLIFDIHFKLNNQHQSILNLLNDFATEELSIADFNERIKFQSVLDLKSNFKEIEGKEEAYRAELEGMFSEVRLEIYRRVKFFHAFNRITNSITDDWKKIRVFNSILVEMKQAGMFDMVRDLLQQSKINLGKRFAFEERYSPFTPLLNGKEIKNHHRALLEKEGCVSFEPLIIWLNQREIEKLLGDKPMAQLDSLKVSYGDIPVDLLYEKIIPKLICSLSFDFNVKKINEDQFRTWLNLNQFILSIEK